MCGDAQRVDTVAKCLNERKANNQKDGKLFFLKIVRIYSSKRTEYLFTAFNAYAN